MFSRTDMILFVALCAGLALLASCSAESRKSWLATFFDGVDKPPPTRRVRTDLEREVEELKRQLAEARQEVKAAQDAANAKGDASKPKVPVEQAKSWEEAVALLPKDGTGNVDWVQALRTGVIAPRASLDPKAPDQPVLPLDVELVPPAGQMFKVNFPHQAHTELLSCTSCHTAIFQMAKGADPITMAKINDGQYCGACHGKVAFGIGNGCPRCHKAQGTVEWKPPEPRNPMEAAKNWDQAVKLLPVTLGVPDWAKALRDGMIAPRASIDPKAADQAVLPLDVELVPAAGDMFKVIFPHKTHTEWLQCPNCHTGIFQMAKGADTITMEKINTGQYCGVCHGKMAFPATACGRCHPVMAGGK